MGRGVLVSNGSYFCRLPSTLVSGQWSVKMKDQSYQDSCDLDGHHTLSLPLHSTDQSNEQSQPKLKDVEE